ncbi:MAG: glycosyltransferase family 2 protein [bacterium]|nr:glycosyltransferase family 2 protein [bacterium]
MDRREPLITVYIVTFRRHQMLRRAIASVLNQTHRDFVVKVINDDPTDDGVRSIINEIDSKRVTLFVPEKKRGATRNFNLVFQEQNADFVSLLEDDNWWEPEFLQRQLEVLDAHPSAPLVVGNERIWRELPDGTWLDTARTVWPFDDIRSHELSVEEIAGSAKICNSSMLIRVDRFGGYLTPDTIPVDVTEHFRERLLPRTLLLNGAPLVNYAETIRSARSSGGEDWGSWQCLLIGSIFVAANDGADRRRLAQRLWRDCPSSTSPRAVSLVASGVAFREARAVLATAPLSSVMRFGATIARRPNRLLGLAGIRRRLANELAFLVNAPLTRQLVQALREGGNREGSGAK